jgi:hypothetical protein
MAASKQADAYAQSLYEQFGLATDMHPDFREHPEIKSQANS